MPESLKRKDLREITEQPLLNYLLALSFQRGAVDFASETNLNVIYADLLHAVYEKRWGGLNVHAADLEFNDFVAVLQETGLAVWHADGRTARLPDIQQRCAGLPLHVLQKFAEGAEKGVLRLLTAFYIRKTDAYDAPTFEFTHKSFGEYLTARRLIAGLYEIQEILSSRRGRSPEKTEERALVEWALLFGPTPLDAALLQFLRNGIRLIYHANTDQNRNGQTDITLFQQMLCRLIPTMLRDGMPMHHSDLGLATYAEMDRQARNAEEALLAMLNACARMTEKVSDISWSDHDEQNNWTQSTRAGAWLRRLRGQRSTWSVSLTADCLSWLNLSSCQMIDLDLYLANLRHADLQGANLMYADLQGADLQDAKLQHAKLQHANLQHADLQYADLQGAKLQGAKLQGAKLQGASNLDLSLGFDQALLDMESDGHLLERWKKAQRKANGTTET